MERDLPEGLLVTSGWFRQHGYSRQLVGHYVSSGRLEQPTRGVYRKPRGTLTWQQAVISLQTILLDDPLYVGGRTALELQGYAHYLRQRTQTVRLYSKQPLPTWLAKLPLDVRFVRRSSLRLFKSDPIAYGLDSLKFDVVKKSGTGNSGTGNSGTGNSGTGNDPLRRGLTYQPWGHWDWPLTLSTPERAILEMLDELPDHESFHQVDMLMEGLTNLSPRRLGKLLADCRSIKVKRLFFFFADRHPHAWRRHLKKKDVDLGSGKRLLVKGGKLDPTYLITVPEAMNGV